MFRKWLFRVLVMCTAVLVVMCGVMYVVDPLFLYRYRGSGDYWLQPEWTSAGLIKNYEYDTVLLGSSVTQNFNAEEFGKYIGGTVLKVNSGGLSVTENAAYAQLIEKTGKAKICYVALDIPQFAKTKEEETNRIREELMDDSPWNDYRYLLSYEAWCRFLPAHLLLGTIRRFGISYPERIALKTDVARSGEWKSDYPCGREIVIQKYKNSEDMVSLADPDGLEERMRERADEYLEAIPFGENIEYIFFFPPYSAGYWREMSRLGYFEAYMDFKKYISERLLKEKNVKILDFQSENYIMDLDNYRDLTHYGVEVNSRMLEMFRSEENRIFDDRQIDGKAEELRGLVRIFESENAEWLLPQKDGV